MRCNRNQFQKELMRGLESTTGGMKAVELQARLPMAILTMARLRMGVPTKALLTMAGYTGDGYACSGFTCGGYTCLRTVDQPPTTSHPRPPTHSSAGLEPRLAKRGQVVSLRRGRRGTHSLLLLRGWWRVLALPCLGLDPNPNPNPHPHPNPNPNPNQVLALRRRLRYRPRPHLLAASGAAAARPQVGRRGRRRRQGTGGGALGGTRR